ncbi:MAG TPA: hypothetical protein VL402_11770 [Xanthobacteraceae bacterium]|jgi:hypothetical protein|nr:hypothetical protein [Xanthobacteraceae bacterium]
MAECVSNLHFSLPNLRRPQGIHAKQQSRRVHAQDVPRVLSMGDFTEETCVNSSIDTGISAYRVNRQLTPHVCDVAYTTSAAKFCRLVRPFIFLNGRDQIRSGIAKRAAAPRSMTPDSRKSDRA